MRENMIYNRNMYQLREDHINRIKEVIKQNKEIKENGVLFFGDSITELYDINEYYKEIDIKYNTGIAGFTSETVLWVCDEAVLKYKPKVIVISVGTNDLGNTNMRSPREIAINLDKLIDVINRNITKVKILVTSTLPCNEELHGPKAGKKLRSNRIINVLNNEIEQVCNKYKNVTYEDTFKYFINTEDKNIYCEYTTDGLHLTKEGYNMLTEIIKPIILDLYTDANYI